MSMCGQSHADTQPLRFGKGTYTQVAMRRCSKTRTEKPSLTVLNCFLRADPSGNTVVDLWPPTECVSHIIAHLDISSPRTQRATHKISAWQTSATGISGERLSRLLELTQYEDVVWVVYRWYGCVKLGSWCRIYAASIPASHRKRLDDLVTTRNHLRNLVFSRLCPSTPAHVQVPQNMGISNNVARPASSLASHWRYLQRARVVLAWNTMSKRIPNGPCNRSK
ncbi:hypothetical protein AcV7_007593 [Taiwanofungus camphoratus]|nr:hypothetical protein AcV7_007593 [Antrodia cinnamomea]